MPIACTRCGASEDGEIITSPIAFAFVHEKGCGHGIGPLCIIKGKTPKKSKKKEKVVEEPLIVDTVEEPAPWSEPEAKPDLTVESNSI